MAFYIFKNKHFPFPKPQILFYLFMVTNFFSPLPTFTTAISFNFTSFTYNDNITYERAFAQNHAIQLTVRNVRRWDVGRATYFKPMHLWDKKSRNLTDFTTYFSFVIDSQHNTNYGDGLAFFLAPNDSTLPEYSEGGGMGLAMTNHSLNTTANHFVAVELDIYSNQEWDPPGVHVGIDINSMKSIANVSWWSSWSNISITQGRTNKARISYNSTSHNLSVLLTGWRNNATVEQSLSYIVNLRNYLPEWVTFGFSGATGGSTPAMHTICTWKFSSTLKEIVTNVAGRQAVRVRVAGSPSPNPAPNPRKNNRFGLAVGLGVGGLALILFCVWKRNRM